MYIHQKTEKKLDCGCTIVAKLHPCHKHACGCVEVTEWTEGGGGMSCSSSTTHEICAKHREVRSIKEKQTNLEFGHKYDGGRSVEGLALQQEILRDIQTFETKYPGFTVSVTFD
jgi:hypothetical protein